ncbi:MAG: CUG-BP- and ETR3-like factor [Flavobacteriales bacterium]|jgi:CUG-BP- and ETR3-like factor
MILHVGNLPFSLEEKDLRAFFEIYGVVNNIVIIKDRITNISKGYGFVDMNSSQEANMSIDRLNNKLVLDQFITVQTAENQTWTHFQNKKQ